MCLVQNISTKKPPTLFFQPRPTPLLFRPLLLLIIITMSNPLPHPPPIIPPPPIIRDSRVLTTKSVLIFIVNARRNIFITYYFAKIIFLVQILVVKQEMKLLILVGQKQMKKNVAVKLVFLMKSVIFVCQPNVSKFVLKKSLIISLRRLFH